MACRDRPGQGIRGHLARAFGQRAARDRARVPLPAAGRGRGCWPHIRPRPPGDRGQVHRRAQRRCLQVDRGPVRRSEFKRLAELLHIAPFRSRPPTGHKRGQGGARPLRLRRGVRDRRRRDRPPEGRDIDPDLPRPRMRGRPWSWITGRPRATDALVVLFTLAVGLAGVLGTYRSLPLSAVVIVLLESLPLWWRRRYPVGTLAFIVAV